MSLFHTSSVLGSQTHKLQLPFHIRFCSLILSIFKIEIIQTKIKITYINSKHGQTTPSKVIGHHLTEDFQIGLAGLI